MWSSAVRLLGALLLAAVGHNPGLRAQEPPWLAVRRIVDGEVAAALAAQGIEPAALADDAEFVRRLYLDVLGRIPTAAETSAYLHATHTAKADRLIDTLLEHEEMPVYWATVFDDWLNGELVERDFGRHGFLEYLEDALGTNKPWDRMAREMIAPDLDDPPQRQAAYFLATRVRGGDKEARIDRLTVGVARAFFGVQLQCAKCHDHPLVSQWRQDHYYGLAAFLARTEEASYKDMPVVKERADGELTFVTRQQQEKTAVLLLPDGRTFDEPRPPPDRSAWYLKGDAGLPDRPYFSRRALLAEHAFAPGSAYFQRAIVNRLWKQLMGRGLVEPVDQMHEANPATHPVLLERLADDLAAHRFDLRRLMAGILHSDAYRRSSRWTGPGSLPAETTYAVAVLKPLTPTQLANSLGIATGHYEQMRAKYEREKQSRKLQAITPAVARRLYLREREVQELAARLDPLGEPFEPSVGQALLLSYHALIQKQLQPAPGNLVEQLARHDDDAAAVRTAFLAVLSRLPTDEELHRGAQFLAGEDPPRLARCRDLVWALLCSAEFRFNH
jgi:hypothetical protein